MKRIRSGSSGQPPKRTYLYLYFETYSDREVTEDELFEALRLVPDIPNLKESLAEMIASGIAEGWLTSTTVGRSTYYLLNRNRHE